jgi:photosystem II stability/assembly factor-like uncharacterized protein
MKKTSWLIILSLSVFFAFPQGTVAQGSWEQLEVPAANHLRSVYFTDSLYGWAVGDTGTIIHTSDGGLSWEVQSSPTTNNIMDVFFLDRQRGWASSWNFSGFYGTLLLKTDNGGADWISEEFPIGNIFIHCILFLDSLTGWIGASPHALARTTDGGQTWAQAAIDTNALAFFPVLEIQFFDDQYGYASGGMFDIAGVTWRTSNGGDQWYPIKPSDAPADEVHGLHVFDSLRVLGAGGDPDLGYGVGMIRTSDGGVNWDYEELSMPGNAFDIDFRNEYEAWAPLGPRQKLVYSLDTGYTWTAVPTPGGTAIFDMCFPDSMHGFGVGYHGAMIRYIPASVGIAQPPDYDHGHMDLIVTASPNPFRDRCLIVVSGYGRGAGSKNPLTLELSFYDQYGMMVERQLFHSLPENGLEYMFYGSSLPAGIYFCRAVAQGLRPGISAATAKIVLW